MGVLTDIVIADDSEARAIATESVPSQKWPGIDAKGIDQVKLGQLWALLAGQNFKVESVNDFVLLHQVSEEGPWVFSLPQPLVRLLADLDEKRAATSALAWAAIEEFTLDNWEVGAVRTMLDELRSLAGKASATNKGLLMWMSL